MESRSEYSVVNISQTNYDVDWQAVKKKCSVELSEWGLSRLSELLKGSVKSVLIEPHYVCKDHRNLFSNFYSKRFGESSPYTSRLHFFSVTIDKKDLLFDPGKYQEHYLGYSVIRPVKERCLGRMIIDPNKLSIINKNNFFCLRTEFQTHIGGNRFQVQGYPYMSQDADVTLCSHSALWGICRYLSERYRVYQELYPFDLINLTEYSLGRSFPYRGMTYSDYSQILTQFGAYPALIWLKEGPDSPQKQDKFLDMCTYIESGFPLIASYFRHAVSLIGHTIDYTRNCMPDINGFIDNSNFWSQLVVVDDNFFPYVLLGYKTDPNNYGRRYKGELEDPNEFYSIESIATAVCPLPEKVFLPAEKARERAIKFLVKSMADLCASGPGPYVTRLFLTSNTAFKRRLLKRAMQPNNLDPLSSFVAEINLPHFIWVMEASPLNLYKQGLCTFELVFDSTVGEFEDSFIYVRKGDRITTYDNLNNGGGQKAFQQYRHNLGE